MASSSQQSSLSRLDRVFTLLENGGSSVTRKAAAKQLGDVQNKHPHELNNLLAKLLFYIRHTEWDARIAAAEAIESVVSQVPPWSPDSSIIKREKRISEEYASQLKYSQFNIDKVLSEAQLLLGSSGDEYQIPVDIEGLNAKERVIKQRRLLEKRLGLTFGESALGVASNDLFGDEDLVIAEPEARAKSNRKKEPTQKVNALIPQLSVGMSSRERNLAKRKAKLILKQQSRDGHSQDGDGQSSKKRRKDTCEKSAKKEMLPDDIPKHPPSPQDWTEWPFNWICDEMINLLFNPCWESRHGACLGIREILKKQGGGCGKELGMDKQEMIDANQSWLADLSIRLLCVIALDRFADFVSDQVVAPVRESCAQTLSVVASFMDERHICDVIYTLLHLHTKEEWELRQSAMLALQYIIAVRKDLQHKLLPICFPRIMQGLTDQDGDVRSVSAKTLMPTTNLLTQDTKYDQQLQVLLKILWTSLHEYDELTSSTQSVLLLLASLIKALPFEKICQCSRPEVLLSFLWPFFHHGIANVREAALSTLYTMLGGEKDQKFMWLSSICVEGMWNVFQSCLLESKSNLRSLAVETFTLLVERSPTECVVSCALNVPRWLVLACQPGLVPYAPSQLLVTAAESKLKDKNLSSNNDKVIAGRLTNTHCEEEFEEYVMKTRATIARMIGLLCHHAFRSLSDDHISRPDSPIHQINHHLLSFLKSQSAVQRIVASLVISSWWENLSSLPTCSSLQLHVGLTNVQSDSFYFNEMTVKFMQVQNDLKSLLVAMQKAKISHESLEVKQVYMFGEVIEFCTSLFPKIVAPSYKDLHEQRDMLLKLTEDSECKQNLLDSAVKSSVACAVISAVHSTGNNHNVWKLPERLNPIIRPLMECIKKETNATVRSIASFALSRLFGLCQAREPCPNIKLIKNLCMSLCSSEARAPTPESIVKEFSEENLKMSSLSHDCIVFDGLITQLRRCEANLIEINKRKRKGEKSEHKVKPDTSSQGAETCLQVLCGMYGSNLFLVVPQLWEIIRVLQDNYLCANISPVSDESSIKITQGIVALEVLVPVIKDVFLQEQILSLLPHVVSLLWTKLSHLRFLCARCIACFTSHLTAKVMLLVLDKIRCNLDPSKDVCKRKGAIETVANIIEKMGTDVVPYAVLLIVPLLGCMSDHDTQIRLLATHCFAQLIQFMPVESSIPDPPDMPESLTHQKNKERRFLEQLFDTRSLEAYQVPVKINATLRSYQEDGVKWLAFLNRYKLHGVLCDEMGLGKTLQTICMMASDHHYKMKVHAKENPNQPCNLISIVICPPTLTGHWVDEVKRFCDDLNPLQYSGSPQERARLQTEVRSRNLIIASYEVVRNDIAFFNKIKWNYCVLDEGHAIRNGKSKTSQTIKTLVSNHRLILTGTPIQNSVLELWSLFDFLIPGFLGSEQEFNVRFTKPILASRDAKSSSKEQEEGVLAMEALHRQVLPFMMRRMKEDVLKDLPPKIIQDYYCDLSPLQLELYEDFARSRAKKNAESSVTNAVEESDQRSRLKGTSHVFQALQYLQKVCNHPLFVVSPSHPQYKPIMDKLASLNSSLHDIKHAAKLVALKQLLLDCGIGVTSESLQEQSVVGQHRALLFCQHRNLLDIIQKDLFAAIMPSVTFLRLDGGVPVNQRFSIVSKFNSDPSIDVLLLTTKVGGLGLNLTGADTVIFVEHDWNPMVDLQAMDRAHRIGQKKVVNVYRLITRGTLEEKILGLQKFKLSVANAVVGEDNRGLQSMGTSQVLELFTVDKTAQRSRSKMRGEGGGESSNRGLRAMMEDLGELWDQSQYDDEYNIESFIQTLSAKE